jgi:hypothetical protein
VVAVIKKVIAARHEVGILGWRDALHLERDGAEDARQRRMARVDRVRHAADPVVAGGEMGGLVEDFAEDAVRRRDAHDGYDREGRDGRHPSPVAFHGAHNN